MTGAVRVDYQNKHRRYYRNYQVKVIIICQGLEELTIKTSTGDLTQKLLSESNYYMPGAVMVDYQNKHSKS
jgi:chromosome condensin MukBEF MukE localization factor